MSRSVIAISISLVAIACGRIDYDPLCAGPTDASEDVIAIADAADAADAMDTADGSAFPTDPLAYYPCDADPAATSSVVDVGGGAHHATCAGVDCPTLTTGVHDGACDFADGDLARIADHPGFRSASGFSLAFWANVRMTGGYQVMFGRPLGTSFSNSWSLEIQPGDAECVTNAFVFVTDFAGSGGARVCTPESVVEGRWYHVAATWDGTNKALYVDGALIGALPHTIEFDAHDVTLGGDLNNGVPGSNFQGQLDEVYFFDRGLSATEVIALYEGRSPAG